MDELVRWLGEQLDEDERIARAASPGPWHAQDGGVVADDDEQWPVGSTESIRDRADRVHIALHDPARVLREIDAKRQVADRYAWLREHGDTGGTAWVLKLLALPYADRPGYLESWRP